MANKYLKIGQVAEFSGKDGDFEVMTIENENLQEFTKVLRKFGKERIGDMTVEEIRNAQKDKELSRLTIYRFNKREKRGSFCKCRQYWGSSLRRHNNFGYVTWH